MLKELKYLLHFLIIFIFFFIFQKFYLSDSYEKKLGKMARAGFNYELCKKVLG